jgi:hypothetical protein
MKLIPDFGRAASVSPSSDEADGLERRHSPDAPMNLLLRFETASGPRTVITCSVSRNVAAEITEVMRSHGQDAHFVDRCAPLSVTDRVMINSLH